jgi:hypothetical protein
MHHVTSLPAAESREPYLTKAALADHYGFSTKWVELRVRQGMPVHRFGSRVRFRLSEVEAWLGVRARPAVANAA